MAGIAPLQLSLVQQYRIGMYRRNNLEQYIMDCLPSERVEAGSVRLSLGDNNENFLQFRAKLLYLERFVVPYSRPSAYRVYIEITEPTSLYVGDDVVLPLMGGDETVEQEMNGVVLPVRAVQGLAVHVCDAGTFFVFHKSTGEKTVEVVRLGDSQPREFQFIAAPRRSPYSPLRVSLGLTVFVCMEYYRKGKRDCIWLGRGGRRHLRYYFQFSLRRYLYPNDGGIPSALPIRVYVDVNRAEASRLNCVDDTLISDVAFEASGGQVYGPSEIGISLHVCNHGVWLYYDESDDLKRAHSVRIGDFHREVNKYNCLPPLTRN